MDIDLWSRPKQADEIAEEDPIEEVLQQKDFSRQYQFYEPHKQHTGGIQP